MRKDVFVRFDPRTEFEIPVHGGPMPPDEARRWLDDQFVANECEPLRVSGKVLTADKVLALVDAVGPQRFEADAAFREAFARAVVAALGQAVVRVDVEARALTY